MEPPNCESCNDEHDLAQSCFIMVELNAFRFRDDLSVKPCIVCGSAASALEMWRSVAPCDLYRSGPFWITNICWQIVKRKWRHERIMNHNELKLIEALIFATSVFSEAAFGCWTHRGIWYWTGSTGGWGRLHLQDRSRPHALGHDDIEARPIHRVFPQTCGLSSPNLGTS